MRMWDSLTEFTKELFGFDVSGGGLSEEVHANRVLVGSGIAASFNEATRAVSLATTFGADSIPRWHDLANVDFAAEAERTFDSDGVYSVGGASLELVRLSLASSTPAIVADGLKLPTSTNINNGAPQANGCCWYVSLGLGSTVPARAPLRAAVSIARLAARTSLLAVEPVVGFVNAAQYGTSYPQAESARASGTSATSPTFTTARAQRIFLSTSNTMIDCGTIASASQFGLHLPNGVQAGITRREFLQGIASDTLENLSSWPAINCVSANEAVDITDGLRSRSEFRVEDWKCFLGCSAGEWAATEYAVISRLLVQAFY